MLLLLHLVIKAQQYFVTSNCMFLDEKTVLKICLNPGFNLTIFQGTGPRIASLSPAILISRLFLRMRCMYVASICLDFH